MVRAKFVVYSVEEGKIKLTPVMDGSEENRRFFKYTPYGQIEIGTINEDAIKQFIPGKSFYVDFTEAE